MCLLIKDKQGIMFYCYSQLFPFMSPIVSAVGGLQAAMEKTEREQQSSFVSAVGGLQAVKRA